MITSTLVQYQAAAALESHLGDPNHPGGPFSFARALEADELEAYPQEALRCLHAWGLPEFLIPAALGGCWQSVEQLLALLRVVARRDLSAAFAIGPSLLAALPVWMAGSPKQQRRVAGLFRASKGLALATTERAHGSDLLANQTRAVPESGGYRLTGEKWLISNATRGAALTVFARTAAVGGPRGFSLFLFDKEDAVRSAWAHLPRVRTLGLRGGDLSGVRFRDCWLPGSARVGPEGCAFELLHRTLTVTRTLCAGMSLGAADTALRLVMGFACGRQLYGGTVWDLPHARHLLLGAFVDGLIGDAVATGAARAVQVGESPVLASAAAKFFVPTLVEHMVRDLSVVLGARFYLREAHPWALFQKIVRDVAIVSMFEGNTVVNLGLVAARLGRRPGEEGPPADLRNRLEAVFRLDWPQPAQINLGRPSEDLAVLGLALAGEQLGRLRRGRSDAGAARLDRIATLIARLQERVRASRQAVAHNLSGWSGRAGGMPPRLLALTARYCALQAGATCFHLWCYNRDRLGAFFRRGDWLVVALHRLLTQGDPLAEAPSGPLEGVARTLLERQSGGLSFGLVPLACGGAGIATACRRSAALPVH